MISITLKKILTFRMEDIDRFFTKLMHNIKKSSTFPLLLSMNTEKTSILPQKNTYAHAPQEECIDRPMKNYHGLRKHRRGCHAYFSFSSG